jgi:hypothetical protein
LKYHFFHFFDNRAKFMNIVFFASFLFFEHSEFIIKVLVSIFENIVFYVFISKKNTNINVIIKYIVIKE